MASLVEENPSISEEDHSNEKISLHLCKVLDMMGYSEPMIRYRRQAYQEQAAILNRTLDNCRTVISGSKGEGLTQPFESDIDTIFLYQDVVCTEEDRVHEALPTPTIFTFRPDYKYQGHNMLKVHSLPLRYRLSIQQSLLSSPTGHQILSSETHAKYIAEFDRRNEVKGKKWIGRSGPATTSSMYHQEMDSVHSLPSVSPSVLRKWLQRPRHHDWPPAALRDRIANMRGNFVAKGCTLSENGEHEWRQCFNEAELLLVHNFDETLTKLYVLLKIINKDLLRHLDTDTSITSYVMKNIVFWLAERYPSESFQPKYLIKWLIRALRMLAKSLKKVNVPYYMIPERNLLYPGMRERVNKRLKRRVQRLIKKGPRMLYKCQKLEFTTTMTHAELSEFCAKRDELEMLHLSRTNHAHTLCAQGLSDEQTNRDETSVAMDIRIHELVYSSWHPHIQKKIDKCENEWDRKSYILGRKDEHE